MTTVVSDQWFYDHSGKRPIIFLDFGRLFAFLDEDRRRKDLLGIYFSLVNDFTERRLDHFLPTVLVLVMAMASDPVAQASTTRNDAAFEE